MDLSDISSICTGTDIPNERHCHGDRPRMQNREEMVQERRRLRTAE